MPTGKYSGVSRKIESADERNRLKSVMKRIRPEGMATVVRTAAAGASEAELIADLGVLIRMWHGILETYKRAASPSLLHKDMNLVYKAARDFITADVDRVLIDDEEEYRKIRDLLAAARAAVSSSRIEYYNSGRSLFDDFKIDDELQKLMRPKINLPSGASIVIESTEALTVIDVNSGKFTGGRNLEDTILKTNIEAAEDIARQVRLRDIGGIIVVDFIDMASESSRDKVVKTMEDHLRRDRTRATIQSFSNLGLLEFTRKRIGKDLGSQLRGACPTCAGMGSVMSAQSVAIETFRRIRSEANHGIARRRRRARRADGRGADGLLVRRGVCGARAFDRASDPRSRRSDDPSREGAHRDRCRDSKSQKGTSCASATSTKSSCLPGRLPNRDLGGGRCRRAPGGGRKRRQQRGKLRAHSHHRRRRQGRLRSRRARDRRREGAAQAAPAARARKSPRPSRRGSCASLPKTRRGSPHRGRRSAFPPITEEEEAQDKALRAERIGEAQPDAIIIAEGAVQHASPATAAASAAGAGAGRGRDDAAGTPVVEETRPPSRHDAGSNRWLRPTVRAHRRRRRRRRGRRGRGGGAGAPMPDRHIFEVSSDGAAHPTGNDRAARALARDRARVSDAARRPSKRRRRASARPDRGAEADEARAPTTRAARRGRGRTRR